MYRASPLLWIVILCIVLLPTAAGRFLLDLAGGLMIFFFLLPILLTGIGWIGWKIIQSKLKTCSNCGANLPNNLMQCPLCGEEVISTESLSSSNKDAINSVPASSATIDIKAEETK